MTNLKDKFTVEDMKEITRRINHVFYQTTHWKTREKTSEQELLLLGTIDHLCRVSSMLCGAIEQQLEGHIETHDPKGYIDGKFSIAESRMNTYLSYRRIDLNKE
jgi:hypothetical protein